MCEETGPPTLEDDLWLTMHYDDPIKRDPAPMKGQRTLMDALEDERRVAELEREANERELRWAEEDLAQQWRDHPIGRD